MMAYLFRYVSILFIESHIFERLALYALSTMKYINDCKLTSIGLKGLAIRPMVDE